MTQAPSGNEDRRGPTAPDETSGRSAGEVLSVVRSRPSVLVGLAVALLAQTALTTAFYPLVASLEVWLLLFVGPPWTATAALAGFVLWVERRPLASVGAVVPTRTDLVVGAGGAVVGLLTVPVTLALRDALGFGVREGALATFAQFPPWALVVIVCTVAVTEEVLFRAYPIERLAEVTGDVRVAAGFSLVAFVLLHVPFWGVGHIVTISGISVVLTVLYARFRRLGPVVVMHFLTNFVLLVVLPTFGLV